MIHNMLKQDEMMTGRPFPPCLSDVDLNEKSKDMAGLEYKLGTWFTIKPKSPETITDPLQSQMSKKLITIGDRVKSVLYSLANYSRFDFWTNRRKDSVYLERFLEYLNSQKHMCTSELGWTTASFVDALPRMSEINPEFQVWVPSNPKSSFDNMPVYLRLVEPNMLSVHNVSERLVKLLGSHDTPFVWHLCEEDSIESILKQGIIAGKGQQIGSGQRLVWLSPHDPQLDVGFGQNKQTAFEIEGASMFHTMWKPESSAWNTSTVRRQKHYTHCVMIDKTYAEKLNEARSENDTRHMWYTGKGSIFTSAKIPPATFIKVYNFRTGKVFFQDPIYQTLNLSAVAEAFQPNPPPESHNQKMIAFAESVKASLQDEIDSTEF